MTIPWSKSKTMLRMTILSVDDDVSRRSRRLRWLMPIDLRQRMTRQWWTTMEQTDDAELADVAAQECCSVLVWIALGQLLVSILRLIWERRHPAASKSRAFDAI